MSSSKFIVINVLSEDVFNDCHIKGSISVPLNSLESFAENIDKHTGIIVYCSSYTCGASAQAWRKLDALGFKDILAYEGGMSEWYHAGFPVEGACSSSYLAEPVKKPDFGPEGIRTVTREELKTLMESHNLF